MLDSLPKSVVSIENDAGLTLRDYFAAAALNALLANPRNASSEEHGVRYAEVAYAYADAMLVARSSGLT